MKYFYVRINSITLYEGKSDHKVMEVFHAAMDVMASVRGTGVLAYCHADSRGEYQFLDGLKKAAV